MTRQQHDMRYMTIVSLFSLIVALLITGEIAGIERSLAVDWSIPTGTFSVTRSEHQEDTILLDRLVTRTDGDAVAHDTAPRVRDRQEIEDIVRMVFADQADNALNIMQCESRGNPEQVGDQHLAFVHEGKTYGESYGLFQIRSGGNEHGRVWTRADDPDAFKQAMFHVEQNIQKAKEIYDGQGWSAWLNCAKIHKIL